MTADLEQRMLDFVKRWLTWSVCLQLVRRRFVVDNEIKFANVHAEDLLFTMCEFCCAQRYLVVPNVFYLYRLREGSAIRENFDVAKLIHKYTLTLKLGMTCLDEFLNGQELFARRADLKYQLFQMFVTSILGRLDKVYEKIPAHALDELLRKEIDDCDTALTAFIFNALNVYRLQLGQARQQNFRLNQLAAQAQSRLTELQAELDRLKRKE